MIVCANCQTGNHAGCPDNRAAHLMSGKPDTCDCSCDVGTLTRADANPERARRARDLDPDERRARRTA